MINEYIRACYIKRGLKTPEQALFHGWAAISFPKGDKYDIYTAYCIALAKKIA